MSQKRLRHIIAGQEMVSSSSDESIGAQETVQQHDGTNTGTAADENPVNTVENKTKVRRAQSVTTCTCVCTLTHSALLQRPGS